MLFRSKEAVKQMEHILIKHGCCEEKAQLVAETMANNSLIGVYTHGINRFKRLIGNIDSGVVDVAAEAEKAGGLGGYEVYEGNRGLGIWNAALCTRRVIELAGAYGIGCVALRNTNHWLRGGTYSGMIADAGMAGIVFTNTKNNTVAWGTMSGCIGNNPIGMAVPGPNGRPNVAADLAMSQFSWGKLEQARLEGRQLPMEGGFDMDGNATADPEKIMESKCIMPTGLWKGSALSILLDLIAAGASGGKTVHQLSSLGDEQGLSQIFIAINYCAVNDGAEVESTFEDTLDNLLSQKAIKKDTTVRYPGQAAEQIRKENYEKGIPVNERIWSDILSL